MAHREVVVSLQATLLGLLLAGSCCCFRRLSVLLTEHAALVDLIPALIEQCTEFEELIGNAGDLVLLHPLTLHRASANPSGRPRFIQNARLSLSTRSGRDHHHHLMVLAWMC